MQSTRLQSATAAMINALAIDHDLPDPRPPYKTLYLDGWNAGLNAFGNLALISLKADLHQ